MSDTQRKMHDRLDCNAKAANKLKPRFDMFARIGRWGTCVDCPCDNLGVYYPELCVHTDRGDHHLGMKDLAESYMNEVSRQEALKARLGDDYMFQ